MRRLRFFHKLFIAFVTISIIPLLIVGLIAYSLIVNTTKDTLSTQAYNSVVKISENIDIVTSEYGEIIGSLLAEDERIRQALLGAGKQDDPAIQQKIAILAGKRSTAIYIVNAQGTVAFATHALPKFFNPRLHRNQGIFKEANLLKNGYVIYPHNYINSTGDSVVFCIARAIRDPRDRILGYVMMEVFKSRIEEICGNINANLNLDLMLVGSNHLIIANLRNPKQDGKQFRLNLHDDLAVQARFFITKVAGKECLVAHHTSGYTGFTTIGILPIKFILESSNYIKIVTLWACLASLLLCLLLALWIARSISHPLNVLVESMKQVENGNLSVQVNIEQYDEVGLLGRSFNTMVRRLRNLLDSVIAKQQQLRQLELRTLQAQINPHFLYNTLDSVKWLAKLNQVPQIAVMVTQLGKLLRSSINNEHELVTVAESIVILESYLAIQTIRYNDQFTAEFQIEPEINQYQIPKLILQPIVENAIVHGFENKPGPRRLLIRGWKEQDRLNFAVCDDGIGMAPEKVDELNREIGISNSQQSIGIQNVKRRIQLYYGKEYRLTIQSELGQGTQVLLRMATVLREPGWDLDERQRFLGEDYQ